MSFQQWMFLIVPNVAMLIILGVIAWGLHQNSRDRVANARKQADEFERQRRML